MAARMAIIAITTSSSISVKPLRRTADRDDRIRFAPLFIPGRFPTSHRYEIALAAIGLLSCFYRRQMRGERRGRVGRRPSLSRSILRAEPLDVLHHVADGRDRLGPAGFIDDGDVPEAVVRH